MPISLSAKKSLRKSLKNKADNLVVKNKLKTIVKKFSAKPSADGLKDAFSAIDKAAKKGIIHKNKASRMKARLSKIVPEEKKTATKKSTKTTKKA